MFGSVIRYRERFGQHECAEALHAASRRNNVYCIRTYTADSSFVWRLSCPQEGDVPYVIEGGYGAFTKNPAKTADAISDWLGDDELLARMSSKAKQASRPMVRLLNTSSALKLQTPHYTTTLPAIIVLPSPATAISSHRLGCQAAGLFWAHRSNHRAISLL